MQPTPALHYPGLGLLNPFHFCSQRTTPFKLNDTKCNNKILAELSLYSNISTVIDTVESIYRISNICSYLEYLTMCPIFWTLLDVGASNRQVVHPHTTEVIGRYRPWN